MPSSCILPHIFAQKTGQTDAARFVVWVGTAGLLGNQSWILKNLETTKANTAQFWELVPLSLSVSVYIRVRFSSEAFAQVIILPQTSEGRAQTTETKRSMRLGGVARAFVGLLSPLLAARLAGAADIVSYLGRYGYVSLNSDGSSPQLSQEELRLAVRRLQEFAGLEPTGEVDEATDELLSLPRCGVKDVHGDENNSSLPQVRRQVSRIENRGTFDIHKRNSLLAALVLGVGCPEMFGIRPSESRPETFKCHPARQERRKMGRSLGWK